MGEVEEIDAINSIRNDLHRLLDEIFLSYIEEDINFRSFVVLDGERRDAVLDKFTHYLIDVLKYSFTDPMRFPRLINITINEAEIEKIKTKILEFNEEYEMRANEYHDFTGEFRLIDKEQSINCNYKMIDNFTLELTNSINIDMYRFTH